MSRQSFGQDQRGSCHDKIFLCRERVANGREALCRDITFYVATECGQMERFCVAIEQFYVTT